MSLLRFDGLPKRDNGTRRFIGCSGEIRIGSDVMLGPRASLFSENHVFDDADQTIKAHGVKREHLHIGHDMWIGSGATIAVGVRVGSGAVIASGSVGTRDVPEIAIVAGVPAKLLRSR